MEQPTPIGRHFDDEAARYDRTRPRLPEQAFDDLLSITGLHARATVIEIGCGSGQATVPLARRGVQVVAIEPGQNLAELARRNTAALEVDVVTSTFEDWVPGAEQTFDAVVAVNSLHWVDPRIRYQKPADLVGAGGHMAVGGFLWTAPPGDSFWTNVQEDWAAIGGPAEPPPPPDAYGFWHFPGESRGLVEEVAARRYVFSGRFATQDYLDLVTTTTGFRQLTADAATELLERVARRIDAEHGGVVEATFVGVLTVGVFTTQLR